MTQSPHDHSSFSFQKLKDYDCLRDVLEAANYTDSGILNTLGVKDFSSIHGNDIPTLLRRTSQNTPLDTLIRLFLIEVPCDITAVRRAICPMELETWVEAGIVKIDHDAVIATLKLLPFQGLIVAFDLLQMLKTPLYEQYVMGIGSSTITLSNLTIKKHARLTWQASYQEHAAYSCGIPQKHPCPFR